MQRVITGVGQLTDSFRQAMDNNVLEDTGVQFRPAKAEIALLAGKARQEDQQTDGLGNTRGRSPRPLSPY